MPTNERRESNKSIREYFIALIAAVLTFAGVYTSNQAEMIRTLYEKDARQDLIITEQQEKINQLQIQLVKKYDNLDILRSFIKGMPNAAWIKLVSQGADEKPEFRMWYINPKYEALFNVSNERYEGKTDEEVGIWSKSVSEQFYSNDVKTLIRMADACMPEEFTVNGELVRGIVCKWTTDLNGTVAIAGMITHNI